ncbi:MAG TPA: hypothetical protein VF752_06575 [Thermoleophilaceae bacterium]
MKLSRTRASDWLAALAGVALIGLMFVDWFGSASAWQSLTVVDVLLALCGLTGVTLFVATATQRSNAVPIAVSSLTGLAGMLATVLVAIKLIFPPDGASVSTGAWLGLAAAAVLAAAGWESMREERRGNPPYDRSGIRRVSADELREGLR